MPESGVSDHLPDFSDPVRHKTVRPTPLFSPLSPPATASARPDTDLEFEPLAKSRHTGEPVPVKGEAETEGIADNWQVEVEAAHDSKWEEIEKLTQSHREEIAELKRLHQAELDAVAGSLENEAIRSLAATLARFQETLANDVVSRIAAFLQDVAGDRIKQDSLAAFCEAVKANIANGENTRIEITGSKPLLDELKAGLTDAETIITFAEAETEDLTASVDDQVIVTRIGEWRRMLEGIWQ